jgi:hypothetical protein
MARPLECCLNSQIVAEQARLESDPLKREQMVEDARIWFELAEVELWLQDHEIKWPK